MKKFQPLFILLLLTASVSTYGQKKTPLLEKQVTVALHNVKTDAALDQVAAKAGFTFSYNPLLIDLNRTINIAFTNKTIREIIQTLFNGKIEGKEKGKYIILLKAKIPEPKSRKDEIFKVSGYIEDPTGVKIPWVSIYNKQSMSSAVSDYYGFYTIELPKELKDLTLNVSKKDYTDTLISITDKTTRFINITLTPVKIDTVPNINIDHLYEQAEETSRSFFMKQEDVANKENIKDTLYRKTQVSLIPFIGTNGRLSGNVINDYSFNIFGGYSMGNQKLEIAGIFNVNRGDVKKVQLAGYVNAVGGNVDGLQMAGFVNANAGYMKGGQLAGFVNVVRKDVDGLQMSGFVNLTWGNLKGAQIAGFVNTIKGKCNAWQVSGFVNNAFDTCNGGQVSGFVNYANKNITGTQVSGFVNIALNDMNGSQVSTFNYARNLKGTQVGFFNYSKSCTGIPVGFISYVNDGYHQLELAADELLFTHVAFRTGVTEFHNIITAGIRPTIYKNPVWTFGYGLGSSIALGKKVNLDIDLTSSQIIKKGDFSRLNLINKGYVGVDIKLAKKFSLAVGGTLNTQITEASFKFYPELFADVQPNIFYNSTIDGERLNMSMWLGGKVALRFL
jgi:hypothetical protein